MSPKNDPRAGLSTYAQASVEQPFADAQYARFYELPPSEETPELQAWYARGQNFVVAIIQAQAGAVIARTAQPDEYVVLQPDATTCVDIVSQGARTEVPGASVAFVPAGDSVVRVTRPGRLVMFFTSLSVDLCERCVNQASYAQPSAYVPPFEAWPLPPGVPEVRFYSLDVADEPGRFGRIWRGSTFMVNVLPPQVGPRDVTQLSPHHHDDFEQCSLALEGAFTHHIRWPWTSNLNPWRDDEHAYCAAPSVAVIPPKAIHTSRGMLDGVNQLIDIFSPPRLDFSLKPGWVLNAQDYPMPEGTSS